jgi:hypothetical protein
MARLRIVAPIGATAALLAAVAPAAAQAPRLDDFRLRPGATELPARVEALAGRLGRAGVPEILDAANRPASANGDCRATAFPTPPAGSRWYCFDPADSGSIEQPEASEWMPQGVTTSADAGGDREALLVSWYDKRHAPAKGVRVSLLDPATNRYRHVLLVYPYLDADGAPSYEIVGRPQGGIHAGGVVWYGRRLYVVDTQRGIRVFDTDRIFDLAASENGDTSDTTRIGRHGSTYHAFGYRYVMPQVGAWVNAAGADNDGDFTCTANGAPKFSSIGLDRSESPHRFVTSEYCNAGAYGRVARWPLDSATGDLQVAADGQAQADEAHRLPVHNVQGAVSNAGTWYLSRSRGADSQGQLVPATPSATPTGTLTAGAARDAGIGPEDLSYWPGRDELWTVTEHPGRRMLYAVPAGGARTAFPAARRICHQATTLTAEPALDLGKTP